MKYIFESKFFLTVYNISRQCNTCIIENHTDDICHLIGGHCCSQLLDADHSFVVFVPVCCEKGTKLHFIAALVYLIFDLEYLGACTT